MKEILWSRLKRMSPVRIDDLVSLARDIEIIASSIGDYESTEDWGYYLARDRSNVLLIKSKIDQIIAIVVSGFLELDPSADPTQWKADAIIHVSLQENLGRVIGLTDKIAEELRDPLKKDDLGRIFRVLNELKSVLYSQIYFPLKKAIETVPKNEEDKGNKRNFLYCLYKVIRISAGVFGSPTRDGTKKFQPTYINSPPSYEKLLTPEGQKALAQEYDRSGGIKIDDIPRMDGDFGDLSDD